jgi:hypothetical protein
MIEADAARYEEARWPSSTGGSPSWRVRCNARPLSLRSRKLWRDWE